VVTVFFKRMLSVARESGMIYIPD